MSLFLVLLWCSVALRPGILHNSRNSRLVIFNSRLGRPKFPIRDATGIGPQAFDLACPSHGRRPAAAEKSTNFPSQREKPGMGQAMLSTAAR